MYWYPLNISLSLVVVHDEDNFRSVFHTLLIPKWPSDELIFNNYSLEWRYLPSREAIRIAIGDFLSFLLLEKFPSRFLAEKQNF